jgi:hypothetical protein
MHPGTAHADVSPAASLSTDAEIPLQGRAASRRRLECRQAGSEMEVENFDTGIGSD